MCVTLKTRLRQHLQQKFLKLRQPETRALSQITQRLPHVQYK